MSKVLKVVAVVAGVVGAIALTASTFGVGGAILGASLSSISAVAGVVSGIAGTLAQVTAKPPKAVGQVTNITIGANQAMPYMMGRSYSGGALIHDTGWGGAVSGVDNPYAALTMVYSCCGPIQGNVEVQADFSPIAFSGTAGGGYYSGYLWRDWLDGAGPAARALVANWAGEPGWSSAHKLSGFFAVKYSLKFDKNGKVWQAGVPQFGVVADGVKVYDPRLDSTFPGGSGTHRINNEATWAFSKNPALHALAYAYGRYQNGKKIFGVDLGGLAIDLAVVAAWANVCTANSWEVNGTIYEPGDKWNNLKLICAAGGGVPVPGSKLRFDYQAAGVSLDTITMDDIADGECTVPVAQPWSDRINTVTGLYTSPDHRWEPIATDPIVDTVALAADGEEKAEQFPFQLVTVKNQAATMAAYRMADTRELGPIVLPVKGRLLSYPVGAFLNTALPPLGLVGQKVKIRGKRRNALTGDGELTLVTETDAKHAFALSRTTTAPPSPTLIPPEILDLIGPGFNVEADLALVRASLTFIQPTAPTAAESAVGNTWLNDATGYIYDRVPSDGMVLNGDVFTIGGDIPVLVWTPSPNQPVVAAYAQAAAAQATADGATNTANAAAARLVAIDDDDVLTIDEKVRILAPESVNLENTYQSLIATAGSLSVSFAAATAARTAWLAVRNGVSPAWNNITIDTPITRGSWDASLNSYRAALVALSDAIKAKAATLASWANIVGQPNAPLNNADVTALAQLAIEGVESIAINYNYDNTPQTSLPKTQAYVVKRGGVDVTSTSTLTATVKSGTISASIAAGVLSLNTSGGALTSAVVEIGGTDSNGATLPAKTVRITRVNADAPATGGGGSGSSGSATSAFSSSTSTTTHVQVSPDLEIVIGSAGTAALSATYEFSTASPSGTFIEYGQWAKWNGSIYVLIGTEVISTAAYIPSNGEPGFGSCMRTETGLTASSTQRFAFFARNSAGSVTRNIYGDVSAVAG